MSSITEIQQAILSLPEADYLQLKHWFNELDWEKWDQQIEEDSESGKLDFLIAEAFEAKKKGTLKELYMHRTTPRFWRYFEQLPESVQRIARRNFRKP